MSLQNKRYVSYLKSVECCIRRTHTFTFNGEPLSRKNADFISDVYVLMAGVWLSVLPDPELFTRRWTGDLTRADVLALVNALKAADYQLMVVSADPTSFKRWRTRFYPEYGQVFRPIQVMLERVSSNDDMRAIRTCLLFATRANFPEPVGLEEKALSEWEGNALVHPEQHPTPGERAFVEGIFPRGDLPRLAETFWPRYGDGHCADVCGTALVTKYASFRYDAGLAYFGQKCGFHPTDMPRAAQGLVRRGELRFVPKNLDKLRTITMEPSPLMFYQQGLLDFMMHRLPKRCIDLQDSSKNADLAWLGSLTGEYATIDLSHASDSISYSYVRELFHNTCLREGLAMTRSREVLYRDMVYRPTYFAPMGSATCFPTQCCVFGSVVDAIMRDAGDRRAWRVYGDDIVLPTDQAQKCIDRLESLGFTINRDKSFYSSSSGFRESCGGEFFHGADVTPVRVSRRFRGFSAVSSSTIKGWVAMANRLYAYPLARLYLVEKLLALRYPPIFDDTGESGVFSPAPTNHRVRKRWVDDLQTYEYRVGDSKTRPRKSRDEDEDIRYFEWLRSHARRQVFDPVASLPTSIVATGTPYWGPTWRSPSAGWVPDGARKSLAKA